MNAYQHAQYVLFSGFLQHQSECLDSITISSFARTNSVPDMAPRLVSRYRQIMSKTGSTNHSAVFINNKIRGCCSILFVNDSMFTVIQHSDKLGEFFKTCKRSIQKPRSNLCVTVTPFLHHLVILLVVLQIWLNQEYIQCRSPHTLAITLMGKSIIALIPLSRKKKKVNFYG